MYQKLFCVLVAMLGFLMVGCNGTVPDFLVPEEDRQLVVASIGDSYASGEGNPDSPLPLVVWEGNPAEWLEKDIQNNGDLAFAIQQEKREAEICHRSKINRHIISMLEIEELWSSDEDTRMRSFACSGATIRKGLLAPQFDSDEIVWGEGKGDGSVECTSKDAPCMQSQLLQLRNWLETENLTLDILLISIGGNDIGFSTGITVCATPYVFGLEGDPLDCYLDDALDGMVETGCEIPSTYCKEAGQLPSEPPSIIGLENLEDNLNLLLDKIEELKDDGLLTDEFHIVLTGYPNYMRDEGRNSCDRWDDGFRVGQNYVKAGWETIWMGAALFEFTEAESLWGEDVVLNLNEVLKKIETQNEEFMTFVDVFVLSEAHGFCAANPWVHSFKNSIDTQGNVWGAFHPNKQGHEEMARNTVPILLGLLKDKFGLPPEVEWNPTTVQVEGGVRIFNDNVWPKPDGEMEVAFSRTVTIFAEGEKYLIEYSYCEGNEVRVDIELDFVKDANGDIHPSGKAYLYESNVCRPPVDTLKHWGPLVFNPANKLVLTLEDQDLFDETRGVINLSFTYENP